MAKMSNKMIAICSAAIGAVYMSGYISTDSAQAANTTQQPISSANVAVGKHFKHHQTQTTKQLQPSTTSSNTAQGSQTSQKAASKAATKNTASHSTTTKSQPKAATKSQPKATTSHKTTHHSTTKSQPTTTKKAPAKPHNKVYKDGTYYGAGSAWNGSVQVAVTTKSDKITSVRITRCTTSYPESYIAGLPKEVMQRQSAHVDLVSGATYSSEEFKRAVELALQKAKI